MCYRQGSGFGSVILIGFGVEELIALDISLLLKQEEIFEGQISIACFLPKSSTDKTLSSIIKQIKLLLK